MNLLLFATFVFLLLGFFNPQASLFWYKKTRTRTLSALIYGTLFIVLIGLKSETPSNVDLPPATTDNPVLIDSVTIVNEDPQKIEEERITGKLKARAARDWPNDYATQEYWINKELEDYKYMLTLPDGPIKRQAERDWPYDFSTQKFWYDEQVEAKERLNN